MVRQEQKNLPVFKLGRINTLLFLFNSLGTCCMSPLLLRQIWGLVEATQTQVLLNLDDESLVQWLLRQLNNQRSLNSQETNILSDYLQSRLPLIRDVAHSRGALI
jgi:hypothetical protein